MKNQNFRQYKKIKIIGKMKKMIMRKKNNLTNKTKNKLKIY